MNQLSEEQEQGLALTILAKLDNLTIHQIERVLDTAKNIAVSTTKLNTASTDYQNFQQAVQESLAASS